MRLLGKALTFDDVLLVPAFSQVLPRDTTLATSFSRNIRLNLPLASAAMDTVTESALAIAMALEGGIGFIHKNMSIENTGRCDSLQLERVTFAWGNFEECNCGEYLFGGGTCDIFGGRTKHAAGKSSLTIDLDNDGDRDLLFSEETCNGLYVLTNTGTKDDAQITSFTEFPNSANPLSLQIFPAPYYEDIDFDGLPDLILGIGPASGYGSPPMTGG